MSSQYQVYEQEDAELEKQQSEQKLRQETQWRQKLENYKQEIKAHLEHTLSQMGYMPPHPSPFLTTRALKTVAQEVYAHAFDSDVPEAISLLEHEIESQYEISYGFLERLRTSLVPSTPIVSRVKALFQRLDGVIDQASLSIDMPDAPPSLEARMLRIERFLAQNWMAEQTRGILAIHVDDESQTTILQIGIAEHGPVYITVPRVLRPDDVAMNSIMELVKRIAPFRDGVDPMAVIDGSYQGLNFNELFINSRVIRAPSGNTSRLAVNLKETVQRDKLSPDNTVILNSAPSTLEQYVSVFPNDRHARHWVAWGDEAQLWNDAVSRAGFTTAPEASRAAFLAALTQAENVIVIVAHSDGDKLFMTDPPPNGTVITAEYLLEHKEQIAANSPFVYLFSCEAGDLANLKNFASTLLECGASGVVASQTVLGAAEGRTLIARLLDEQRGEPPIEDFWQAMREVNFYEMEVFLA